VIGPYKANGGQSLYAASKSGLVGFTKSLALEVASRKVRVNAICPGFISTPMTEALDEKTMAQYKSNIPLGYFGDPSQVAHTCKYLIEASYMTGQAIILDGGLSL
jgi:NAD(P)-dependent dehydrogenase (short-subunit alcohol dehydrogenase family)